ncbi:hypothetical protein Esti_006298 [Eimeria stiedai]
MPQKLQLEARDPKPPPQLLGSHEASLRLCSSTYDTRQQQPHVLSEYAAVSRPRSVAGAAAFAPLASAWALAAAAAAAESARESPAAADQLEAAAASPEEAAVAAAPSAQPTAAAEASSEAESVPKTKRGVKKATGDGGGFSRPGSREASESEGESNSIRGHIEGGGKELVELMNTVREQRTRALDKMRKGVKHLPYLNTDLLLGVFVTVLVVLYAFKVRTRRNTFDELTLKMSRQARWFSPVQATYPADDGFTYVVSLDFKGLERVVLPKRYTQQGKEELISLFEQTLQYFETVPPDETSAHLIEDWSPSETIQPINILVVRLPYGQDPSRSLAKRKTNDSQLIVNFESFVAHQPALPPGFQAIEAGEAPPYEKLGVFCCQFSSRKSSGSCAFELLSFLRNTHKHFFLVAAAVSPPAAFLNGQPPRDCGLQCVKGSW